MCNIDRHVYICTHEPLGTTENIYLKKVSILEQINSIPSYNVIVVLSSIDISQKV